MTGLDWQPLISTITSVVAIAISCLTLGWTIYRDAVRKPKLRVAVAVKKILREGRQAEGPFLFVEALNLGPIPDRVGLTFARKSWIKRRFTDRAGGHAMVYPDYGHWATTRASTRLEVGDQATFVFPYTRDCFVKENYIQVGVADGFSRIHWCQRREFQEVQQKFERDFLRQPK